MLLYTKAILKIYVIIKIYEVKMAKKVKQHFVPKFYLKNFSDGIMFNIYNIKSGLIINVPYASQCYKNNFYGKDKIYEEKLSILESKWSYSIKTILSNLKNISLEDENSLKEFCCFQKLRTEAAYKYTQNMFYDTTSEIMSIICQYRNLSVSEDDIKKYAYNYVKSKENPENTMKRQIDSAIELSPILNNLQFTILENVSKIDFITSDNPIVIGNEYQTENGLGLDCIGFYCLCPLSPKYYAALTDSKIYYKFRNKKNIKVNEDIVRKINLLQFKNCLTNIFFKDSKTFNDLKKDLEYYETAQKGKLLDEYNNKYNNFLSNQLKSISNELFFNLLEKIDKNLICFISKKLIASSIQPLFHIDKKAKPFKNELNYNFSRSAMTSDILKRIAFIKSCTSEKSGKTMGHNIPQSQRSLDEKYERFLYDYFK